jgi:putative FmdB family regulatory protein
MPLYEYACTKCDHDFEMLVFNGDEVQCPKCAASEVQRKLSLPAQPRAEAVPSGCDSSMPPCGPACRRYNG